MSVDVSGKRFTVPREITASGNFLTAKFYVKDMPVPHSLYNRISWFAGTPNRLTYYREGEIFGDTVYSDGEWVSDAYYNIFSKITFATGTTLTDSEYEWLTSFAVEETLYLAEGDSLGQVANAIRDRSWAVGMYNFPDGFDAAIRAIGNYYIGGTVAWNQPLQNGNFANVSGWTPYRATYSVASNEATITNTNTDGSIFRDLSMIPNGHKLLIQASAKNVDATRASMRFEGISFKDVDGSSYETGTTIRIKNGNGRVQITCIGDTGESVMASKVWVCDLTDTLGSIVADYLYTLETGTPGAGVAKFRELFPDDYYPYHATPVLTSFKPGDWPVNAGMELRGIITLEDGKWGRFYSDESNKGVVYRRNNVMPFIPTGVNWEYMSGDYFRWSSPSGLRFFPYSSIPTSNGTIITDAYPFGGNIDLSQQDPVQDPTILKDGYIMQGYSSSGFVLYVKDSTITSDHLNEFKTKNAAKTLIGVSTFTYE